MHIGVLKISSRVILPWQLIANRASLFSYHILFFIKVLPLPSRITLFGLAKNPWNFLFGGVYPTVSILPSCIDVTVVYGLYKQGRKPTQGSSKHPIHWCAWTQRTLSPSELVLSMAPPAQILHKEDKRYRRLRLFDKLCQTSTTCHFWTVQTSR